MGLQYRSDTGAILMHADGSLMDACCCEHRCHDCDPVLPKTFNVSLSMTGTDTDFKDAWQARSPFVLTWSGASVLGGCQWIKTWSTTPSVYARLHWDDSPFGQRWHLYLYDEDNGHADSESPLYNSCSPARTYTQTDPTYAFTAVVSLP